jgi:hypothetical protein
MNTNYDIFICYRWVDSEGRTNGRTIVRDLQYSLEQRGFRVFSDYDELIELSNLQLIQSAISHSRNFVLLLTKGLFDGFSNPKNCIRMEIECAIASGCNIIPIDIDNNFDGFPDTLPTSLVYLRRLQIFEITTSLFQTCIEHLEKMVLNIDDSNAWVFVSHSNKDFAKIIQVRNKLESLNYKPLLFFLKCLEDDTEIFELIKREIKARDRFILCDSQNSRSSKWVQKEIEYIKSLNRPYEIVDLDADESVINECIERFDRRSSAYIWSTSDEIADHLSKRLIGKSFKVGILPSTYLYDYLDFKRGIKVENFKEIDSNAYIAAIINRELNMNEMQVLDSCSDWFRAADGDTFLLYVASDSEEDRSDLLKKNMEFLKEMYQGNGIHARYITCQTVQNQAELIMQDIVKLDNHRNAK